MITLTVKTRDLITKEDLYAFVGDVVAYKPKYIALDTETDGLNIKFNKPFLISFGFIDRWVPGHLYCHTYTLDLEQRDKKYIQDVLYVFEKMKETCEILGLFNALFDMHMMDNVGHPLRPFSKITDTQFYVRLANDAIAVEKGGIPLDLKAYAMRKITPDARVFENELTQEISSKIRAARIKLQNELNKLPILKEARITGRETKWTIKMIDTLLEDKTHEPDTYAASYKNLFLQYEKEMDDAHNYKLLNRANVTKYAHYDIVYTLGIFLIERDELEKRGQTDTLIIENNAIEGMYELERTGQVVNYDYLLDSKKRMFDHIIELRKAFQDTIGEQLKVNQSKRIKSIFLDKYLIEMASCDKGTLLEMIADGRIPDTPKQIAKIAIHLRSMEKWYTVYIRKWLDEVKKYGLTVYPTYKQAGTVTGRVSSLFQQFPGKYITKLDDEETVLFEPRKMFICPEGAQMFYFDYAAMELRIQAIYSALVGHPDITLCRCFVPWDCTERDGKYYLNEDQGVEWHALDPHGLTAKAAFNISENDPDFKQRRKQSKRVNFGIIYGVGVKKLASTILRTTEEIAQKFYDAFHKTYPNIQYYYKYIEAHLYKYGYLQNLFGRRYYGITPHLGKNYLIQGSGADYTKQLLPQLMDLLRGCRSRICGYLHDEFSFLIYPEDHDKIQKIKEIMEQLAAPIKLVVEVESTDTNWGEKHEYEDADF